MKRLLCCIASLAVSGITPLHAGEKAPNMDLGSFRCEAFLHQMDNGYEQEMRALTMWLDGYLGGISGNTEINWHDLGQYTEELITYCRQHSSSTMLEAARKAGIL